MEVQLHLSLVLSIKALSHAAYNITRTAIVDSFWDGMANLKWEGIATYPTTNPDREMKDPDKLLEMYAILEPCLLLSDFQYFPPCSPCQTRR